MAAKPNEKDSQEVPHHIRDILGNMVLAHEVIINDKFELNALPENTFEKKIQVIVHKAFWDNIQEQLERNPPDYSSAFQLLKEIKQNITELLSAKQEQIKSEIEENLDLEFIKQEVENNCFDLYKTASFIVSILLKICAPARDEEIKKVLDQSGTVNVLRGIMEALDHMKLDMANIQLKSIKPILIQQAVEYEKTKFQEYLRANPDGLSLTTAWLRKAYSHLKDVLKEKKEIQGTETRDGYAGVQTRPQVAPQVVLTDAYFMLLAFDAGSRYPETLLMDELRLRDLSYALHIMGISVAVMTIAWSTVAARLTSDKEFNNSLKHEIFILLNGVLHSNLQEVISQSVYTQVTSETAKMLEKRGLPACNEEQITDCQTQLSRLLQDGNTARSVIGSRLRDFVLLSLASEHRPPVPHPWHLFEKEVVECVGLFVRVITHNKRVFEPIYLETIEKIMTEPC